MDEQLELLDSVDRTETTQIEPVFKSIPARDERGVELLRGQPTRRRSASRQLALPGGGGTGQPAGPPWRRGGSGMVGMALGRPIPEHATLQQVRSGAAGRSRGGGCGGSRPWCFRRSERAEGERTLGRRRPRERTREGRVGLLGRFGERGRATDVWVDADVCVSIFLTQ